MKFLGALLLVGVLVGNKFGPKEATLVSKQFKKKHLI